MFGVFPLFPFGGAYTYEKAVSQELAKQPLELQAGVNVVLQSVSNWLGVCTPKVPKYLQTLSWQPPFVQFCVTLLHKAFPALLVQTN